VRTVNRSALVPYSAQQMYALVVDVAAYPSFLRSCSAATVHSQDDDSIDASLEFSLGGIKKSFRTRNALRRAASMDIALIGGPFRRLAGGWRFEAMGDDGCKLSLELEFEFESIITDAIFGHYFEDICNRLIDSFSQRAHELYG
jgi:ribosome-associated toxin RatA of RatAB toxin-antitoxin module